MLVWHYIQLSYCNDAKCFLERTRSITKVKVCNWMDTNSSNRIVFFFSLYRKFFSDVCIITVHCATLLLTWSHFNDTLEIMHITRRSKLFYKKSIWTDPWQFPFIKSSAFCLNIKWLNFILGVYHNRNTKIYRCTCVPIETSTQLQHQSSQC